MYAWILNGYSRSSGYWRLILRVLVEIIRRVLIALGDPSYRIRLRGNKIVLPISHKLPIYLADYPFYDTLPGRVADFIRQKEGVLRMVDVGANVGHTLLSCSASDADQFLAVEANPVFAEYLLRNTRHMPGCCLVQAYCGSGTGGRVTASVAAEGGTARVVPSSHGIELPRFSLDQIINKQAPFSRVNFIKVDTDGNDFDVLHSGDDSIASQMPTILFECDPFDNSNYWDDFAALMAEFSEQGYKTAIVYDNFGYLFAAIELARLADFRSLLYYQLISRFGYYDVLILPPEYADGFLACEQQFFLEHIADAKRRAAAEQIR